MKQLVLGLVSIISVIIILVTVFSIQGRGKVETTERVELSKATEQAISDALIQGDFENYVNDETLSDEQKIKINNQMAMTFADTLADSVATVDSYSTTKTEENECIKQVVYSANAGETDDKNFKLEVNIITSDVQKGLFQVEVVQTFTGSTGALETAEVSKTALLEQNDEVQSFTVEYYYPETIGTQNTSINKSNITLGTMGGVRKPTIFNRTTVVEGKSLLLSDTPQDITITNIDGSTEVYKFSGWKLNTSDNNYFDNEDKSGWLEANTSVIDSSSKASTSMKYDSSSNTIQLIAKYEKE